MSKDTASNQDRTIATKGTKHVARTKGADDVLINLKTQETAKYENYVETKLLKKGQTEKTLIAEKPIWTQIGEVGPPSEEPNDGHHHGNNNGNEPYLGEATPTSWSDDMYAEGDPVIRTDDSTEQNTKNCKGYVDGSELGEAFDLVEEYLKKACTLTELKGKTTGEESRELGFRTPDPPEGAEPDFIEVLVGDEIELTSTRVDLTSEEEEEDVDCVLVPEHTTWEAIRSGGFQPDYEEEGSGKTFTVGGDLTSFLAGKQAPEVEGFRAKGKTSGIKGTSGLSMADFLAALGYLIMKADPGRVRVVAKSCNGTKQVDVNVYPAAEFDGRLELGYEKKRKIESLSWCNTLHDTAQALSKIKNIADFAVNVGSIVDVKVEYAFFAAVRADIDIGFKPCTKEVTSEHYGYRSPAHVGLYWKIALSITDLIKLSLTIKVPLLSWIAAMVPGLGWVLSAAIRVIEKAGYGLFLNFIFDLGVGLELADVGLDQHGLPHQSEEQVAARVRPAFSAELELDVAAGEVRAGCKFQGQGRILGALSEQKDKVFKIALECSIQPRFYIKAKAGWFEGEAELDVGDGWNWDRTDWWHVPAPEPPERRLGRYSRGSMYVR